MHRYNATLPSSSSSDATSTETASGSRSSPSPSATQSQPHSQSTCATGPPPGHLALSKLQPRDESFLQALAKLEKYSQRSSFIDKAVKNAAKKCVFATEEQQEKIEYVLLAAEKLQLAVHIIGQAKLDVLFRELEGDESGGEGLFEEFAGRECEEGVMDTILSLVGKVESIVGDVDVPDSASEANGEEEERQERSERGDETRAEDKEDEWPKLAWARRLDAERLYEHQISITLQFLDCATVMVAQFSQLELLDILDQCRDLARQAKGKVTSDTDSRFDWPKPKEHGIYESGGLSDVVVSVLRGYRYIASDRGVDERVYGKAVQCIEAVEERMETEDYTHPEHHLRDEWRSYYAATTPSTSVFCERLREYATNVSDNNWEYDERVPEALEVLIEQAKGKVDVEEDEDESLALSHSFDWGEPGKIAVLIRGYSKLCHDEGTEVDGEVLRLAQEIIERANRQYEEHHAECECEYCGHQLKANLDGGDCGKDCACCGHQLDDNLDDRNGGGQPRVILRTFDSLIDVLGESGSEAEEDTVVGGGSRPLSPIDEDPEAETASEGGVEIFHGEGHSVIVTEDGEQRCENHTIKAE
jgi:hypothetical protein